MTLYALGCLGILLALACLIGLLVDTYLDWRKHRAGEPVNQLTKMNGSNDNGYGLSSRG